MKNEAGSIKILLQKLAGLRATANFEVIIIDDASTDTSPKLIKAAFRRYPWLNPLFLNTPLGKWGALGAGFAKSRGEVIVTMDADMQDDPMDIPLLLVKMKEGYDIVSGYRINRADLNHRKSVLVFETIPNLGYQAFTSLSVVLATYFRLDREISSKIANDFLQMILESNIDILFPSRTELMTVMRYCKANTSKSASISEITISVLMEKRSVRQIFTFDFWHNTLGTTVSSLLQD